jgi:Ca2+-transporting ATPase
MLDTGRSEDVARTLAVVGLTVGNLMLVAVNATAGLGWRVLFQATARAFWWVAGIAGLALTLAVALPGGRRLLRFDLPSSGDLAATLAAVTAASMLGALLTARRR